MGTHMDFSLHSPRGNNNYSKVQLSPKNLLRGGSTEGNPTSQAGDKGRARYWTPKIPSCATRFLLLQEFTGARTRLLSPSQDEVVSLISSLAHLMGPQRFPKPGVTKLSTDLRTFKNN